MKSVWDKIKLFGATLIKAALPVLIEWVKTQVNRGKK